MSKKQEEKNLDVADYIDRFADWTEKNAKIIVLGFLVFTLTVVGFWAVSAMKARALNVAANDTGVVNRRIDLLEKAISETKDTKTTEFKTNKEAEVFKIHNEALNVAGKYSGQSVADFTVVRWASFLVNEDKHDMALEILEKSEPSGARELSVAGLFLKAFIFSKQKKMDEALAVYTKVIDESKWKVFHGEALIQKGTILQAKGRVDDAIVLFDQAKNLNKDSSFSKDAAKYKRLLKLKKNHPELFKTEG